MADWFHLPPSASADIKIFTGIATADNLQWQHWTKPRGKTMIYAICIGSGAGGGGGFTGAAAAARGGGGGGGGGALSKLIAPLAFIPDELFIQVGAGGVGGTAGNAGANGIRSTVGIVPDNSSALNIYMRSGGTPATGGGGGTGAAAGAAGAAETVATVGTQVLFDIGIQSVLLAGQAGIVGGAQTGAAGGDVAFPTTGIFTMGAPGGGGTTSADFAGGQITASAGALLSNWRPAQAAAGSNNGSGGVLIWKPLWSYPGLGGAASNAGIGGFGGNGAPGSGGGGGGGGTTGGSGGDGGPGLVILIAW